jgi:hypothetical protein
MNIFDDDDDGSDEYKCIHYFIIKEILCLSELIFFLVLFCIFSVFERELSDIIPVVHTSIAGCRIIGRLSVGMYDNILSLTNVHLKLVGH